MKPCGDCPFVKKTPLDGAPDWVTEVINLDRENPYFHHSCHKTDPNADGYKGAKKKTHCSGHMQMMFNSIDGTPGKGGVYESIVHLGLAYAEHYQNLLAVRKSSVYTTHSKGDS